MLALLSSLWFSFVVFIQSINWLALAEWIAASGFLALVARMWQSRGLWGAKVPFLAAAFELADVFGFSPSLLAEWVKRRSWYRRGQAEGDRVRRLFPGACVMAVCFSCSGAQLPEGLSCPLPDVRKATLPAAISLAKVVDQTGATAKDVCQAILAVKLVPCDQCADRLDAVASLLACESP